MSWSFYVGDHWKFIDAYHVVSFFRRLTESTFADAASVSSVLRIPVTKEEMQAKGLIAKAGTRWHLWADKMPAGITPKVHDVIRDANSVRWTILQVEIAALGSRFVCTTIQER